MIAGFLRSVGLNLLKVPMLLLGLPIVWFALPYQVGPRDTQRFTQYPEYGWWGLWRLPKWALWWDNAYDGMLGDKRGWWANACKGEHTSRYNMWRWAALRNPANYFSRDICGVDVSALSISLVKSSGVVESAPYRGWYLLKGTGGKRTYPRFYMEFAITATHGIMVDIGWKVKLSHNDVAPDAPEKDRIKGIVFALSPWKELI